MSAPDGHEASPNPLTTPAPARTLPAMDWLSDLPWGGIGVVFGVIAGAVGAACGIGGLVQASRSNATAEEALKLAKNEDARADRADAIAREHRDVRWEQHKADEGILSLGHVGTTEVRDLETTVRMDGFPMQTDHRTSVSPGERVGINLISQLGEYRRLKTVELEQRAQEAGYRRRPTWIPGPERSQLRVDVTLTWQSPAGAHDALKESYWV